MNYRQLHRAVLANERIIDGIERRGTASSGGGGNSGGSGRGGATFEFIPITKIEGINHDEPNFDAAAIGFLAINNIPLNVTPQEDIIAGMSYFQVIRHVPDETFPTVGTSRNGVSGTSTEIGVALALHAQFNDPRTYSFQAFGNMNIESNCVLYNLLSKKSDMEMYIDFLEDQAAGGDGEDFEDFLMSSLVEASAIPVKIPDLIIPVLKLTPRE